MVRAYIDDVLVITKIYLQDRLNALHKVLQRLTEAVLKVNTKKSLFGRM